MAEDAVMRAISIFVWAVAVIIAVFTFGFFFYCLSVFPEPVAWWALLTTPVGAALTYFVGKFADILWDA